MLINLKSNVSINASSKLKSSNTIFKLKWGSFPKAYPENILNN